MREAVEALVVARVVEIGRGDGSYVTGLTPAARAHRLDGAL